MNYGQAESPSGPRTTGAMAGLTDKPPGTFCESMIDRMESTNRRIGESVDRLQSALERFAGPQPSRADAPAPSTQGVPYRAARLEDLMSQASRLATALDDICDRLQQIV